MSEENHQQDQDGPLAQFVNRTWVLALLFAAVVGALVWVFTRPRAEQEAEEEPSSDRLALRRAVASGKLMHFTSEAQRLYRRGLGQCREGDVVGARRTWADVVAAFRDVDPERPWVELAESGLEMLKDYEQPAEARHEAVGKVLQQVQQLREAGQTEEAKRLREALERLYRDDPAVSELLGP